MVLSIFIAEVFVYVPSAALAGLIVVAASSLFKWEAIKQTWFKRKTDIIPLLATFVVCLYSSSFGIIVGIVVHALILLGEYRHPVNKAKSREDDNLLVLTGPLLYPSSEVR